ncbi:unnamed protein product [Brassica oleracea]
MITEEVEAVVEEEAAGPMETTSSAVSLIHQTVEEGDEDVVGLACRLGRPHFGKQSS